MKRIDIEPYTLFVSTMISHSITDYRRGSEKAKKFLFEGKILRHFLEEFGFKNIRVDLLRERIQNGDKIINLC